jgi:hypothetical protein
LLLAYSFSSRTPFGLGVDGPGQIEMPRHRQAEIGVHLPAAGGGVGAEADA